MVRVLELSFSAPRRVLPRLSARLFEAGAGAVEERDEPAGGAALVVYVTSNGQERRLVRAAREVVRATSQAAQLRVGRRELDDSWRTEWTRHLRAESITQSIVLVPLGQAEKLPRGKRRIVFDPAMAFGVGSHPTTRLAARAVERRCRRSAGCRVLDVGTGTGVLALVAAVSGAGAVLGVDVDPVAVRSARKNAALNGLGDRCRFTRRALARTRERFDIVVANIEVWVLEELAPLLSRATAPGGTLVVSGVLEDRADELATRFESLGMRALGRGSEDGWALLELSAPHERARATPLTARRRSPHAPR